MRADVVAQKALAAGSAEPGIGRHACSAVRTGDSGWRHCILQELDEGWRDLLAASEVVARDPSTPSAHYQHHNLALGTRFQNRPEPLSLPNAGYAEKGLPRCVSLVPRTASACQVQYPVCSLAHARTKDKSSTDAGVVPQGGGAPRSKVRWDQRSATERRAIDRCRQRRPLCLFAGQSRMAPSQAAATSGDVITVERESALISSG